MPCSKCKEEATHSVPIREGSPFRNPATPKVPDKSHLRVVGLCDQHWQELRKFLGL